MLHSSEIDISGKLSQQKFIRLSLDSRGSESNELDWRSLQAHTTSLRTLMSFGLIKINYGDSLVAFPNVRTLLVVYANFGVLVESLSGLKHLRYLSIQYCDQSFK